MVDPPRVVVMGGSLGGLTAALVLRDVGCDVQVLERSTEELQARGAGIAVLDATVRYFVERRALDVEEVCTSAGWIRYLHPDGSTQHERPHRYRFSSWNTIYQALLRCFDAERYHLDAEVVAFSSRADEIEVRRADGSVLRGDLLVCADGIGSTARATLLPEVRPQYAGYIAWRGTVNEWELTNGTFEVLRDAITYQLLANSHILVYPIPNRDGALEPGRRLMNFVWYRNVAAGEPLATLLTDRAGRRHEGSLPPGMAQARYIDELLDFARRHLAPPIAEVVLRTADPFVQVIFDIEVPAMVFGRICLMGDAAFAVRPHAAAGTAKAAADAWALAEALAASDGDMTAALTHWEAGQLTLGRRLLARTRDIGDRSQFTGQWDPADPRFVFGLHGPGD
jgi:2,6-dihydroxypyridine 3-monooxygenase